MVSDIEKQARSKEQAKAQLETIVEMVTALQKGEEYEEQDAQEAIQKEGEAKRFCEALQSEMIRQLPGYEDAPWGWEEEPVTT